MRWPTTLSALLLLLLHAFAAAAPTAEHAPSHPLRRPRTPLLPLERPVDSQRLTRLRGGGTIGPLRVGPVNVDVRIGPRLCVFLNAAAGTLYSLSLVGLDPNLPDPTLKYWQHEQTDTTKAILQYFALTLVWVNAFMVYALLKLGASPTGLLQFQSFGWASVLVLLIFQVNAYGFDAQQDTLGIMISLLLMSTYLGFMP